MQKISTIKRSNIASIILVLFLICSIFIPISNNTKIASADTARVGTYSATSHVGAFKMVVDGEWQYYISITTQHSTSSEDAQTQYYAMPSIAVLQFNFWSGLSGIKWVYFDLSKITKLGEDVCGVCQDYETDYVTVTLEKKSCSWIDWYENPNDYGNNYISWSSANIANKNDQMFRICSDRFYTVNSFNEGDVSFGKDNLQENLFTIHYNATTIDPEEEMHIIYKDAATMEEKCVAATASYFKENYPAPQHSPYMTKLNGNLMFTISRTETYTECPLEGCHQITNVIARPQYNPDTITVEIYSTYSLASQKWYNAFFSNLSCNKADDLSTGPVATIEKVQFDEDLRQYVNCYGFVSKLYDLATFSTSNRETVNNNKCDTLAELEGRGLTITYGKAKIYTVDPEMLLTDDPNYLQYDNSKISNNVIIFLVIFSVVCVALFLIIKIFNKKR